MKNNIKKGLLMALLACALSDVFAQGTPQYIYTPGSVNTGNSTPLAYQTDNRSQIVMPGGLFPTAPSGLGISAVYFHIYTSIAPPSTDGHSTFVMYAGNAPGLQILSTAGFASTANLTQVINQPGYAFSNMVGGMWLQIPFSSIVPYDPTQPILLDFQWTGRTGSNWYLDCNSTAVSGFSNSYAPSPTATAPTSVQSYVYMFGVDLVPLPSNVPKVPPLANFINMNNYDTLWVGSPSVLVNTSSYSDTNYWAITGYSATNANGPWTAYSNPNDVQQTNNRGTWMDTVVNKTNFYYTFPQAGYYRIKLYTVNKYGTSFVEKSVYVSNPTTKPKALFFSSRRVMAVYDRSQFNDLSTGGPTKWKWWLDPPCYNCGLYKNEFFYNGTKNDSVANPYLQGTDPGMYKVCLAVSNAMGSDTFCQAAYIKVIPGFQMCNGADTVGTTSEGAVMPTLGSTALPQYYANGCSQGFRLAPCADTVIVTLERLRLRKNGGSGAPGDSLYIKTSLLPGATILRRYGGNDITAIKDSLKTLRFSGQQLYIVYSPVAPSGAGTLVSDSGFLIRWSSIAATYPAPKAKFSSPDTIYSGYKVIFNNQSTGKYTAFAWDINNDGVFGKDRPGLGIDSTNFSPSMIYNVTVPTNKTVCLRTYSCVGSDTVCKTFLILPTNFPPFADFSANKTYGLTSDTFFLFDNSFNGANQWKWKFEPSNLTYLGGTDSTSQNPIVFLNTNTSYSITLTATNAFGSNTRKKTGYITTISYPSPGSQFTPTSSVEDFGITRVRLNGSVGRIDTTTALKPTDGSAYLPLYNLSKTTLFRGGKYVVMVYRGANPQDSMNLRVWIDFNRNANYLDLGETLINDNRTLKVMSSDTFVVPSDASVGISRMLVGASAGFSTISPYSSTLGVYEEFGIIIGRDLIKPTVNLINAAVAKTELNKPYTDAGAIAMDNIEGNISSRLIMISNVDISHVGYYTVKYVVADNYGNLSDTVVRTVQVEVNQTGPTIKLRGQDTVYVEVRSDSYSDLGADAFDNSNVDISSSIITTNNVDTATVGNWNYTYTVYDAFGFKSVKQRAVIVRDTRKPTIHPRLNYDKGYVVHQIKTPFDENVYLRVDDNYWQNLVPVRQGGNINIDQQGIYTLYYKATDGSGNVSDLDTLNVKVTNTFKPIITLVGASEVTVKVFSNFNDPKAIAKDYYNNPLQVQIDPMDSLNTNKLSSYTRTYIATDAFGNESEVTRLIKVKDLDAPQITVLGDNPVVITLGTKSALEIKAMIDGGTNSIKVSDNYDPNPTITTNVSNVPLDKAGTYMVTYDAVDGSGNKAQQKQRYIQLLPPTGLAQLAGNVSGVHVYPNPSKGVFTIEVKQGDARNIRIYNIAGVLVREVTADKVNGSYQVDLSNESEGMYLVRVEGVDKVYTSKVNITR